MSHFLFEAAFEENLCEAQSVRCRRLEQHTNSAVGPSSIPDIHQIHSDQLCTSYISRSSASQDVCLRRTCIQIMKTLYVAHTLRARAHIIVIAHTQTHRKNVLSLDILEENDE